MDSQAWIVTMVIAGLGMFIAIMFLNGDSKPAIFKKKQSATDKKATDNLMRVLKRFSSLKGFHIIGKTTLEFEDIQYTFDAILVGFFGTIGISSMDLQGEVYGETNKDVWTHILQEKKSEFKNPIKELNGSVKFFKDIYRKEKIKAGNVETFVVFTSKNVQLYAGKNSLATTIDKLYSKLDSSKYLVDNGADIDAIKFAIEKYSLKNKNI